MAWRDSRKHRTSPVLLAILLLFLSVQLVQSASENDPYKILGVSRSATQTEIKRAYKNLAKEWWVTNSHRAPQCTMFWQYRKCTLTHEPVLLSYVLRVFLFNPVWLMGSFKGIQTRTRTQKLRTCLSRFPSHMRWVNMHHIIPVTNYI